MKHFIAVTVLLLSIKGYSQTSVKSQPYSAASLNQYMWSFSKNKAVSEKPLVDFDVIDNWRGISMMGSTYLSVSDDGKYFAYTINKMAYNDYSFGLFTTDSLVIQSTKNGQRTVFPRLKPGSFTADSKRYIFQDGEALCFLQLSTAQVRKIAEVASYKISQGKWLAYQLKGKEELNFQNLATGKENQFAAMADYNFSNNGEWLICQSKDKQFSLYNLSTGVEKKFLSVEEYLFAENGKALFTKTTDNNSVILQYISLPTGDAKTIWKKEKASISNYCKDAEGKQIAFNVVDSSDATNTGVWYYAVGMDKAVLRVTPATFGAQVGLTINEFSFSDNAQYIKLSMQSRVETPGIPESEIAGLEVWNHKDLNLQSAQQKQLKRARAYDAIANIATGKVMFTESNDKKLSQLQGDFALIRKDYKDLLGDRFWEKDASANKDSVWIVDLREGGYHLLSTRSNSFWFSPAGNYLVYFDNSKGCHYYSYDLSAGIIKDISSNASGTQIGITDVRNDLNPQSGFLAAWLENQAAVLVYDDYDIWRLDLTGKQPAENITNGLGRSNNIILSLSTTDRHPFRIIPIVKAKETLLLRAYSISTKQIGFYKKDGIKIGVPVKLYIGNYFMNEIGGCQDENVLSNGGLAPVKAKNTNSWIVQRQSTNDAPNYFETTDFKSFRRLTNFQPQQKYQWLTEEIVSFKHLDGITGQGILYKPENFDPNKKYPVVIAFYGQFSNNMYQFHYPTYLDQAMEIGKSPFWFLSNGYLVFAPDIAVAPLKYGPKAYSVIEGAAQYLKTLHYVDANKIGCGSHSWGGKLAAYIFTHSKSITATAITEGFLYANPTVQYLSSKNSQNGMEAVEKEQQYGSLWENKEAWLDQTTVLNADKAASPLLLLCNHESAVDYQEQTFQFFNALRRLDKNVWWLKYDKGGHTLNDQKELKDYTIRYTQFFDHYLKNAPAPQWMTQGIPYKLKGIESRYELDPQGECNDANGEPCPICEAWNKQYKRTPEMFTKPIVEWNLDKDIVEELERKQYDKRKELDKEGEVMNKKILDILKNGYPEDEKGKTKSEVPSTSLRAGSGQK